MIDEDFAVLLATLVDPDVLIEKGKISSETTPNQRIYFQQATGNQDIFLDASTQGLGETVFDVEVASLSNDEETQTLIAALKTGLNAFRGQFGYGNLALGMFVADHTDDYVPLLQDQDEGYFVAAAQVTVYT